MFSNGRCRKCICQLNVKVNMHNISSNFNKFKTVLNTSDTKLIEIECTFRNENCVAFPQLLRLTVQLHFHKNSNGQSCIELHHTVKSNWSGNWKNTDKYSAKRTSFRKIEPRLECNLLVLVHHERMLVISLFVARICSAPSHCTLQEVFYFHLLDVVSEIVFRG